MCGIIGYTGAGNSTPILVEGLETLAYRGYDSSGIAVWDGCSLVIKKEKGAIAALKTALNEHPISGSCGIGHTRWATHGEPSIINSHPHQDAGKQLALVHNGIIENYLILKKMLSDKCCSFASETDTEVVAQLIGSLYTGHPMQAITETMKLLHGSFSLAIIFKDFPDKIFCVCKESPMVVGFGSDGAHIASDIPAILGHTRNVTFMNDMQIAVLTPNGITYYDEFGQSIEKETVHIDWDIDSAKRGSYDHFMLKEICEEPSSFHKTIEQYICLESLTLKSTAFPWNEHSIRNINRLRIVGCGTAYHAGLVGKRYLSDISKIPAEAEIASEFRYNNYEFEKDEALIVISQSGETADTIAAMRMAKQKGVQTIAICNVIGSTIAREADFVLFTYAGPEIAVAATKSYLTQITVLFLFALYLARLRKCISADEVSTLISDMLSLPDKMQQLIDMRGRIEQFVSLAPYVKHIFFIGRGIDYPLAMESALKMKEISYIQSEALAAGELKHGTIALIEEGSLVVALATQKSLISKTVSNIEEVRVRGANVLAIVNSNNSDISGHCNEVWEIDPINELFAPFCAIILMQLFAYYMALQRNCNVDKPRNLAKSVTVE